MARSLAGVVTAASYPAVLGFGFAVYATLLWLGWAVALASYVAVLTGAALVTLHETKLPYRREWRPTGGVVTADALFMGTVQGVLPLLLSFTVVIWLAGLLDTTGLAIDGLWPVGIPLAAQVCLMLLAADFPRYWLHRAFHGVPLMWRLHAVHHSPHQLYWLNVGRFHPIEKSIQYAVDSLPFALLGAPSRDAGGVLRVLRDQRVLPALQLQGAAGAAQLRGQRAGATPLAPLEGLGGVQQQLRQQPHPVGHPLRHAVAAQGSRGGSAGAAQPSVSAGLLRADADARL